MNKLPSNWDPDPEALNRLLTWLKHLDEKFALLRLTEIYGDLIKFFENMRCLDPLECVCATINRVFNKIQQGVKIENLEAYLKTTARYIWQEYSRKQKERLASEMPLLFDPSDKPEEEKKAIPKQDERKEKCLWECLDKLPPRDQKLRMTPKDLFVNYKQLEYDEDKIKKRKELAKLNRLTENASQAFF